MKKTYLKVLGLFCLTNCNSQSNSEIVKEFIQSYNKKDSIKTFKLLHNDFIELWEKDTVITNKKTYSKNYSWGKVMNDKEDIEIVKVGNNFIETISTYYSDRDRLLDISPYKSKRVYEIIGYKIAKIVGQEFEGYNKYEKPRREAYNVFFRWLSENHKLEPSDFPFDKTGAKRLKNIILEYKKNN